MKNFTKKILAFHIPRIVAIITLFALGLGQANECVTMFTTLYKLHSISSSIAYIEELAETTPAGWNEETHEEYEKYVDERNALINSNDSTVSNFASADNAHRALYIILNLTATILLIYSGVMILIKEISQLIKLFSKLKARRR